MTAHPFRVGEFVWCAFPVSENPIQPGPHHIAYTLAVSGVAEDFSAILAYTTSQTAPAVLPVGVRRFSASEAALLGQDKAFLLNLRRMAFLPVTSAWFPRLAWNDCGIVGRAPGALRREIEDAATDLMRRRGGDVERLGPFWRS